MMMEDDGYNESVENIIKSQGVNAEYAVATTGDNFAQMFSAMDDDYMRERAADVKDISERLISILNGDDTDASLNDEPAIIVADDLAPSETVQMDKDKVLSFVTVHGSLNSHTAILARTMAIPALVGTPLPLDESVDGKLGIVDGSDGTIYVDPDEETLAAMQKRRTEEEEKKKLLLTLKGKENITLDGQKILLYANIGNIKDLAAVMQNDAGGIGLFRSEFIYLEQDHYPTEEEQFRIYKQAAETMAGKRVIIRTLDIGADKQCDYFEMEKEENPALGCRAIRICLTRPEIFKTQLRALFRASAYGKIAIMYPMITSVGEVRQINDLVGNAARAHDFTHQDKERDGEQRKVVHAVHHLADKHGEIRARDQRAAQRRKQHRKGNRHPHQQQEHKSADQNQTGQRRGRHFFSASFVMAATAASSVKSTSGSE